MLDLERLFAKTVCLSINALIIRRSVWLVSFGRLCFQDASLS